MPLTDQLYVGNKLAAHLPTRCPVGEITQQGGVMSHQREIEFVRETLAQAEIALTNYFRSFTCDPEQERQLMDAVKTAQEILLELELADRRAA
jgi:hypothetical protein